MSQSRCAVDSYLKFDSSAAASPPSSIVVQDSNFDGALYLSGRGAADFEGHKVGLASLTIKLDNAASSSRSTINETDVDCGGACSVSSSGPVDVTASSVQASDIFLKFGGVQGSNVVNKTKLDSITLTGGLFVTSSATLEMFAKVFPKIRSHESQAQRRGQREF